MMWTLDETIARLNAIRDGDEMGAGEWPVVMRTFETCHDVDDILAGECVGGPVVEIWANEG